MRSVPLGPLPTLGVEREKMVMNVRGRNSLHTHGDTPSYEPAGWPGRGAATARTAGSPNTT